MSTDQKKLELKDRLPLTKVLGREDGGEGIVGQTVGVAGWVRTKREQGTVGSEFCFLEVSDGTMVEGLQVVVVGTVPDYVELMKQIHTGASVFVVGELVKPPVQSKQKVELKAKEITLLGACDPDKYPLAKKHHTLEHLRSIGHLRARTKTIAAVARIRNALAMATHDYFQSLGFIYLHTPLITASDCEGAGEMFGVTTILKDRGAPMLPDGKVDWAQDFFKRPAFLTVSGQLDAEIYATAISKVYTFGPTFRAENSNTTRHLAEFWMIEPEIAFADLAEDMQVAEGYIKHVLRHVLEKCAADMAFFEESEIRLAKEKEKEEQKAAQQKGKQKGKQEAPKPEVHKDWKTIPLRERIASVIAEPFARVTTRRLSTS
jgi:asparaginyl-tRNA synthetase